ncbi:hypothetical protein KPH14_013087 [Odynerus spinipes]|uniref:Uncharacterized protein n=1 Tax=Odynerus spinipes TaxID=1348599 RepID=A0AAD9VHN5_9HYME|nr:hypothetical protein KPH14_013087 [Odynerus spinipes]
MLDEFCRSAVIGRVLFGDSGQSSPIGGSNDNAELVALSCELSIQFLDNKRLIDKNDPLRELLGDQIWNWRSNSDSYGATMYVRELLSRHLSEREREEINVTRQMNDWFRPLASLLDWYDERPCRRYVRTYSDLCNVLNRISMSHFPRVITLTNKSCDFLNYQFSSALRDFVRDRVNEEIARSRTRGGDGSDNLGDCDDDYDDHDDDHDDDDDDVNCAISKSSDEKSIGTLSGDISPMSKFRASVRRFHREKNPEVIRRPKPRRRRSRFDCSNYFSTSRRNAVATHDAFLRNGHSIDNIVTFPNGIRLGRIRDDPWCAELTLGLGCVYRFIGDSTNLSRDSILVLLAFLPDEKNLHYRCDYEETRVRDTPCYCSTIDKYDVPRKKLYAAHIRGVGSCNNDDIPLGETCNVGEKYLNENGLDDMPRLLMLRVSGDQGKRRIFVDDSDAREFLSAANPDDGTKAQVNRASKETLEPNSSRDGSKLAIRRALAENCPYELTSITDCRDIFVLSRSYYSLNRCNSLWTQSLKSSKFPREDMHLFGYPLVLHNAVTSYRVQGETIVGDKLYVDFDRMSKEHALVALSRMRSHEQLVGVLNIDSFGRL